VAHTIPCTCRSLPCDVARRSASDVVEKCVQLIDREYHEWPALSLTKAQMERLWGIDHALCQAALDFLIERHQLRRAPNNTYVRRCAGDQGQGGSDVND
jgi:hypothetical protein